MAAKKIERLRLRLRLRKILNLNLNLNLPWVLSDAPVPR
jgi:hypothetical protein